MTTSQLLAVVFVGGGLTMLVIGLLARVYEREEQLADLLDLPWGERDIDVNAAVEQHSSIVENTIGVAGRFIEQVDAKGSLLTLLERARLPIRPGEFVLFVISGGFVLGSFIAAITSSVPFGVVGFLLSPFLGVAYLNRRIARRTRKFEEQFPDALTLIASSLSAGHTFLRSIQLMCEEAEAPISEEFSRVVSETALGDPLVDALARMATRLDIRDVDWVVQAIRIQQTVGGKLADLLHTLADFIRAREEIRREIDVLTAEGKISAYVLGALPVFLGLFIQVTDPGYLNPMFRGWGWVWIGGAAGSIVLGMAVIGLSQRSAAPAGPDDAGTYLRSLEQEDAETDEFQQLLAEPFLGRIVRPIAGSILQMLGGVLPHNYRERVHLQLLYAGLANRYRAEEIITLQVLASILGLLFAVFLLAVDMLSGGLAILALALLPIVGAQLPRSWLERQVEDRKDAIRRDLPDTLDLLAISVEAGLGFEAALGVVCDNFESPLAEEFARTLREMELGLPRREALHNLKRRTEVPELSNFVLTLTQADALGMPVGRVLKISAEEMRKKRQQWAREKAAKLPVKILFPLVLFIFPAIFVVLLGPAASDIGEAFGG